MTLSQYIETIVLVYGPHKHLVLGGLLCLFLLPLLSFKFLLTEQKQHVNNVVSHTEYFLDLQQKINRRQFTHPQICIAKGPDTSISVCHDDFVSLNSKDCPVFTSCMHD